MDVGTTSKHPNYSSSTTYLDPLDALYGPYRPSYCLSFLEYLSRGSNVEDGVTLRDSGREERSARIGLRVEG